MPCFYPAPVRQGVLGFATSMTGTFRVPAAADILRNQPKTRVLYHYGPQPGNSKKF